MSRESKLWNGQQYHLVGPTITCNADKDGCQVFPLDGPMGKRLVLAHDLQEAKDGYRNDLLEDPEYCEHCGEYGSCSCVGEIPVELLTD